MNGLSNTYTYNNSLILIFLDANNDDTFDGNDINEMKIDYQRLI